jgi:hypothetical protein
VRRRNPSEEPPQRDEVEERRAPLSESTGKSVGDTRLERLRDLLDSVSFDREPTEAERRLAALEAEDDDAD